MDFALPFLQAACFFEASEMIKRLACAHFLSESLKKHKRCFQPVCGKIHKDKKIFTGNGW